MVLQETDMWPVCSCTSVARFGKVGECLVEPVLFSLAAQGVTMAECQDMPVFMGQNVNQVFIGAEVSVER